MKNWTIGKRIIAGGTILLVLLVVVGAIGFAALSQINRLATDRLLKDSVPGIIAMADVGTSTLRAHIRTLTAGNAANASDAPELKNQLALLEKDTAEATSAMTAYEATIRTEEDRLQFTQLKQKRAAYRATRDEFIAQINAGKEQVAQVTLADKVEPAFAAYRDYTLLVLDRKQDAALEATHEVIGATTRAILTSEFVSGICLLVAVMLGWIIIRGVNRILNSIANNLDSSAEQVAAAATQVSASSHTLAEGSSEQAASLEETSSSLEELSSMTKRNADSAVSAKTLSGETRAAAESGNSDMDAMRQAMDAIKTSSNDISKIIKTIDEIAFQTNILALNAAVEAARAGEAGAGFAVVADEVRALAQRSATSAKETADKIQIAIQNGDRGAAISRKVALSLGVILEKARKVDELVAEIATASNEQNQGIGQINTAMSQMDKVTQSNAAGAEETAAAAAELQSQSASLKDSVEELQRLVDGTKRDGEKDSPTARSAEARPLQIGTPAHHKSGPAKDSAGAAHQPVLSAPSAHDDFFKET